MTTYHIQVNTFGDPDGVYSGNAVAYTTKSDAVEAAKDLFMRWTAVETWRVIDSDGTTVEAGP